MKIAHREIPCTYVPQLSTKPNGRTANIIRGKISIIVCGLVLGQLVQISNLMSGLLNNLLCLNATNRSIIY